MPNRTNVMPAPKGRGAGVPVKTANDFHTRKTSADASEKRQAYDFGKGGKGGQNKMFDQQEAGTKTPGIAGKPDDRGPGKHDVEGGKGKMHGFEGALPAVAGHNTQPGMVDGSGSYREARLMKQSEDRFGSNDRPESTKKPDTSDHVPEFRKLLRKKKNGAE